MSTARERVQTELAELEEKYGKLEQFISQGHHEALDREAQSLLTAQLPVMAAYGAILRARLRAWKEVAS